MPQNGKNINDRTEPLPVIGPEDLEAARADEAPEAASDADEGAAGTPGYHGRRARKRSGGQAPDGAPETKRRGLGKKHRKKRKLGRVVRIEDLEEAMVEDGVENLDDEAVVSMYLPRRRMHRLGRALLRMDTLQKALLAIAVLLGLLFALSFMQENMGNFTINLNRLELFRRGVAIADNPDFEGATARLTADAVADGTNIAAEDIPDDVAEIDGSHNGKDYVAYTFYMRNAGKSDLDFTARLKLISASKGAEKAARVRVWRDGVETTYAAPAADGNPESGCENFESDKVVTSFTEDDFKVGYVHKYTVVIWLDGDDPECVDDIIGGAVEFGMDFDATEDDDSSLFAKFVQDIADTLTGNDPISAAGNDAPDYYQNHQVTWADRRNQENPPA